MKLKNRIVLLTGAARGIGREIAKEMARVGAEVLGVDLRLDDLQETAREVGALGSSFKGFACDITDHDATKKMVAEITGRHGGFDVLINNAGVLPSGPYLDRDFEVWRRAVEINLLGMMHLTYLAVPHLKAKGAGHVVNIASISGKFGSEGVVAYSASKHGVVGFSSALRSELEGTGVSVSWVCPSQARTRLAENVSHTFLTPLVEPEDVARAVRGAVEHDKIEVFVPRRMRLVTSVFPALAPRTARWVLRISKASRGWLVAQKELPPLDSE